MFAVAVTRSRNALPLGQGYRGAAVATREPTREDLARVLAGVTGGAEADWRMRIGRPLPWLVAMDPDAEAAERRMRALREAGLGAVCCDTRTARAWSPRGHASLIFEEAELRFVEDARVVPFGLIRLAILATLDVETTKEEISRAPMAAQRENQPSLTISSYRREGARSRALYLVLGEGEPIVRLEQGQVRLADADGAIVVGSSARERFDRAVEAILTRAPSAIVDRRLLEGRRARSTFATAIDGLTRTASNVRETELVAHVIALAWRERQIDPSELTTR